jgi:site-specific DNA-adenine methylase
MGSKLRLADWILSYLPDAPIDAPQGGERDRERVFVDLFAGGCAMTHAAIKSGRFDKVIANDLSVAPQVFKKAVEYGADDWMEWVSREEFKALDTNTVDGLAKALIFGYGYTIQSYGYSDETVIKEKKAFEKVMNGLHSDTRSISASRIKRLDMLKGCVDLKSLTIYNESYENININDGDIVYADPPYRGTRGYGKKQITLDYKAFDSFLRKTDHPVFVSECTCPDGCTRIASHVRKSGISRTEPKEYIECLYIQSRFVDWYREVRPDVVLECDC